MKKILMFTAAALTLAGVGPVEAAKPFNGWSVGLNGGWNQDKVDVDASGSAFDKKLTFNTGVVGVHFDWTTSKANSFLFGIGFGLGYNFGKPTDTFFEATNVNQGGLVINNAKAELEMKRKFLGEITMRLGWNFNDKWALYGILATRAQSVEKKIILSGNGAYNGRPFQGSIDFSEKDVVYGFAPGIGFDVRVNESWSIGAQYKYYFDSSANAKFGNESTKPKIRSHNAIARVSYHF